MRIYPYLRCAGRLGLLPLICLSLRAAYARNATWNLNPVSDEWNTAANWTPATVPNGPADIATFGISNQTDVVVVETVELNQIVFEPGASAFTITSLSRPDPFAQLHITGDGIINNSGVNQTFVTQVLDNVLGTGYIAFFNQATAGSLTTLINGSGLSVFSFGAVTEFYDSSTAGDATLINEGSPAMGQPGNLNFHDDASAGNSHIINHGGTDAVTGGGQIIFSDSSTADHATVTCNGGEADGAGGSIIYVFSNSMAASGTFTVNGGAGTDSFGAAVLFFDDSSLGNATFTINGGMASGAFGGNITSFASGVVDLADAILTVNGAGVSDAMPGTLDFNWQANFHNAVVIANGGAAGGPGGQVSLADHVEGGNAQFKLFGNSVLDISALKLSGFQTGSIEGEGTIQLGTHNLTVGTNDQSTNFSGLIEDQSAAGSLGKVGLGTLTLSGANTYSGGTTVLLGTLKVDNTSGSGTGTGSVSVDGGTLGGRGIIAGAVTIGTGTGTGAFLTPAKAVRHPATLTLQSSLTFKADSTYQYKISTRRGKADQVIANGVTIEGGAQFSIYTAANKKLHIGQVFTALNNTSADPISGTFANLADDSTITVGNNTFQADYQGGDGNDLTLTVVP